MISLMDVSFGYQGQSEPVLNGLSLNIPNGSITSLLGPNGTGKTTLLHLILGILRPQQGEIQLNGRPQSSFLRREMSRMLGIVPQNEYITFDFSVFEYVLLGRAPYIGPLDMPGIADQDIAQQALDTVGLAHLRDRPVTTLSGGERQLVIIARTLTQQPRVMLLDEPTSHLDLGNKSRILGILRRLNAQGVTIVFTTHDPQIVSSVADFVVLLYDGRAIDAGPPESVLTSEKLSSIYQEAVRVLRIDGRSVVLLD